MLRLSPTILLCCYCTCFISCSKSDNNSSGTLPAVSVNSVSQERTLTNSTFRFTVSLDKAATADATVNYKTIAATATEDEDYEAVSGTITIAKGQSQANFEVQVTGDSLRKEDEFFYVQLENPKNCVLGSKAKGSGNIINANGLYFPVDNSGYTSPASYAGYSLVWSDEFDGTLISDANWQFEAGNNNGWGNNELEYYTNRSQNAFVSQGNLIIEARKESFQTSNYTSARMITKGNKEFTYGRVDIRAKLPKGKGIWPALWMLGSNISSVSWPACGEIDIMELVGHEPNKVYGTLHWGTSAAVHDSKGAGYTLGAGSFDEAFHVYSLIWTADSLKIYLDNNIEVFKISRTEISTGNYPFDKSFFFIFNIAVGGNWPGSPDDTTVFPQRMVVDYIRVFQ
ncbi:family 16 glycosylhydrolase [Panacibacter microcysteis]|uniref:family 16 glycosylhydrolase n=1 Tax=Panacibacter microcysteis TaxID=2793269 RepID=UPI0018CB54B0|nr:family 16 glycosylhydrolase [Panacibacter microcysteis]